jgi:cell division protein FtsI/penicillin-binding protein 2
MKKKHIFLIFIISITFFAIIIYFLFNIQKGDTKNKKILYRSNKQFEKQIHEKINNFDMKNL